jgi:hypothetical protein
LQSRSLPARGCVGLEVHRCLCIIDAGNVFISTVMGGNRLYFYAFGFTRYLIVVPKS